MNVDKLLSQAAHHGQTISYHQVDVTSEHAVANVFESFKPNLKAPIRGLVDCVGISDTGQAIDYPARDFLRILNINIMGTYVVARAVVREMQSQNADGAMVLVASMSGWVANKV